MKLNEKQIKLIADDVIDTLYDSPDNLPADYTAFLDKEKKRVAESLSSLELPEGEGVRTKAQIKINNFQIMKELFGINGIGNVQTVFTPIDACVLMIKARENERATYSPSHGKEAHIPEDKGGLIEKLKGLERYHVEVGYTGKSTTAYERKRRIDGPHVCWDHIQSIIDQYIEQGK